MKNTAQIVELAAMLNDVAKSSVVLDREVEKEKSRGSSGSRIRCPLCGWSPRKADKWFCTAAMSGTRSIPGASALPASISGLRPDAFRALAGRRIQIGMRSESGQLRPRQSREPQTRLLV